MKKQTVWAMEQVKGESLFTVQILLFSLTPTSSCIHFFSFIFLYCSSASYSISLSPLMLLTRPGTVPASYQVVYIISLSLFSPLFKCLSWLSGFSFSPFLWNYMILCMSFVCLDTSINTTQKRSLSNRRVTHIYYSALASGTVPCCHVNNIDRPRKPTLAPLFRMTGVDVDVLASIHLSEIALSHLWFYNDGGERIVVVSSTYAVTAFLRLDFRRNAPL